MQVNNGASPPSINIQFWGQRRCGRTPDECILIWIKAASVVLCLNEQVSNKRNVMKTAVQSAHSPIWYLLMGVLLIAALMFAIARPAAQVGSRPVGVTGVFSFDMWCLEMQLYPTARCDARSSDDVKAYENYRAAVEQYAEQRMLQQKRDQDLKERLDRGPSEAKR